MSQNNIPNTLPSVERIAQRVSAADRSQQKEIRLTIVEARELLAELAVLTIKLSKTISEIHTTMLEIKTSSINKNSPTNSAESFDGGGF